MNGDMEFEVHFPDLGGVEANIMAKDLRNALFEAHEDASVNIRRDDETHMDLGSIVQIILAAPAVTAIAQGIGYWIKRHKDTKIEIRTPKGTVIMDHVTAETTGEIPKILDRLFGES